tara:strand:- start:1741 stop:2217 length:477 start_codon:yes stop_codon:yes gene_type:complete
MKLYFIKMSEMKEMSKEIKSRRKKNKVEKYQEKEEEKDDFDKYLKTSNILSDMQQHLISHIGLSMGIVSTIIFISNTKTFISSYLKYIIFALMLYSFMLAITGFGEYTEKFIQFSKNDRFKEVTTWDFVLSIIYFVVGLIMMIVIILLYISLTKEKLV